MKREPLFKAKRVDNGAWVEGFYSNLYDEEKLDEQPIIAYQNFYEADMSYPYPSVETIEVKVDSKTVCEYAGFSDKNGESVFEGDYDKDGNCVVFCDECHGWQFGEIDIPTKQVCIPCHNCDGNFMIGDWIERFEVVGNIND